MAQDVDCMIILIWILKWRVKGGRLNLFSARRRVIELFFFSKKYGNRMSDCQLVTWPPPSLSLPWKFVNSNSVLSAFRFIATFDTLPPCVQPQIAAKNIGALSGLDWILLNFLCVTMLLSVSVSWRSGIGWFNYTHQHIYIYIYIYIYTRVIQTVSTVSL